MIPGQHNGHERTTDKQPPSLPLSQGLDTQIAALAKLPWEQRGDGLRILFGSLAALDDFEQGHFRSRVGSELGIKKREFDDYLRAARKASRSPNLNGDRYKIEDDRLCAICFDREGVPQTVPLCNFVARIVAEEERDDGRDISRRLVIEGISEQGKSLPSIYVETTEFDNVAKWAIKGWGSGVVVRAGQSTRDKLREAIQVHSLACGIMSRKVFTHLGWRTIAGRRVYLTSNGALGVTGVCVDLDEPSWQPYALPQDIVDPAGAMQDSIEFLNVAELTVTVPLWSGMWLAPLVGILQPSHVIWLHGSTGNMKSTIAALALCHYGAFDHLSLPASWLDTGNELEKALFVAKDSPIVIDDFAP